MSQSLKSVAPNATLAAGDPETMIRRLKAERACEIDVAGPVLSHSLSEAGLIDESRLYLRPVVLGGGQRFFGGNRGWTGSSVIPTGWQERAFAGGAFCVQMTTCRRKSDDPSRARGPHSCTIHESRLGRHP